ncbi:MAG TPA: ABC transporter permease [Bryobacteraceae bacterium]|nr:ABC transporter permease [Bryobacteraceae bacterium]
MWVDLLHGLRALRRNPVFTAAAVLSLALGIGANTAIFSLLDQVVLRSLPVADPERLVALHGSYSGPGESSSAWSTNSESVFPYPLYRDLRDRIPAFAGILACAVAPARVTWQGSTQAAQAEMTTGNYFTTLGVTATLGRVIASEDDGLPGAHPVAVLSHGFWTSHFGANPGILNQSVAINGHPFVVIGVASPNFNGLVQGESPDLFLPIAMQRTITPTQNVLEDRTHSWLNFFARLKPGVSVAGAQAATDVVFHAILDADLRQGSAPPEPKDRAALLKSRIELRPAAHGITELREKWEKPLRVLMIMVGLVLLIACANVAGLLVARGAGRQREIAIRLALGAKRWVLVKQLLLEGLLLAMAGAAAGLLVEHWSTVGLLRILPRDAAGGWLSGSLDLRVLVYTLALSVVCALLFALIPALQATRPDVAGTLKDQASNVPTSGNSTRLRRVLVTLQVALSLLLVVGAGLFSASALNLLNANRGFRTERLWMFSVDATLIRNGSAAASAFYHDLLERLAALPNVSGIAASDGGPYSGAGWGMGIRVEGYQAGEKSFASSSFEAISPGYFRALGIPLRAGREFNDRDLAAKAVVVNEAFIKHYLPNQNPLGRHLGIGGPQTALDREIVGVVADTHTNVRRKVYNTVYFPYSQREAPARMVFYVRNIGNENGLAAAIRRAVREADAGLPVPDIQPLELRIRDSLYTERLVAVLASAFGILATLLAALGIYGVIAFAVARRTAEIGVRMALGALPAAVLRMVLLDAGRMVAAGLAIGLGAAFALSRYVESQLFGIRAADLTIYAGAAAALAAVAALAALVPAWKASRIDPISALRYE